MKKCSGSSASRLRAKSFCFSVCTGALLCGAAGVLAGRQVTSHWSVRHLMPHYGAVFGGCKGGGRRQLHQRCWRDGWLLDAALVVVSLLRGDAAAQEIQLAIE